LHLRDRFGLTPYDAAYLELALRRQLPLATLDGELARAARAQNVPLVGTA
jgi:predicted nucleic acid-binding protein